MKASLTLIPCSFDLTGVTNNSLLFGLTAQLAAPEYMMKFGLMSAIVAVDSYAPESCQSPLILQCTLLEKAGNQSNYHHALYDHYSLVFTDE
jgi:hypothetical protein